MGMFDKEAEENMDDNLIEQKVFELMDKIYFKGDTSRSRSPIPSSQTV